MSNFGIYSGTNFIDMELTQRDWLVEGLMRIKDSVILVGDSKAGKSLLTFQLICSLTSGEPFLGKHSVAKESKVLYIQLEGELSDSQDRMRRMMKSKDLNTDNFWLAFKPPLHLNTRQHALVLIQEIKKFCHPEVIVIDPIYFAYDGSMSDDFTTRQFLGNMRIIKDEFDCNIMLVHHTHNLKINNKTGEIIDEGDRAMFGSVFFRAFPDHILLFTYNSKSKVRVLSCTTQRSGEIKESSMLRLVEPNPLFFEPLEGELTRSDSIYECLDDKSLTVDEIVSHTAMSRSTVFRGLDELFKQCRISKSHTRPVRYTRSSQ